MSKTKKIYISILFCILGAICAAEERLFIIEQNKYSGGFSSQHIEQKRRDSIAKIKEIESLLRNGWRVKHQHVAATGDGGDITYIIVIALISPQES